ncbi:TenA/THI-4 family protein [Rhodopseudomonas palustris]|uniref:TenA/THI-4 family protein n=1 Tax=Rhodopseudomonas palustris TaxID=1076 RepID=UPI002ACE1333|nr:TenA/THI-4 family protein [Rhodopseudomonas palustris]WQH01371.1 TenA/THI-4 family protein [Rhodopseudomonas palustris]
MAVPDDFKLIREIRDAGGRKQVFNPREQHRYEDLVVLGWLKRSPPLESKSAFYQITDRGKAAAVRS